MYKCLLASFICCFSLNTSQVSAGCNFCRNENKQTNIEETNISPSGKSRDKECQEIRLKRGGVLYQEYATAIHTKRYRTEFTPAQWKTILLQKRVRIPLTAEEHRSLEMLFIGE